MMGCMMKKLKFPMFILILLMMILIYYQMHSTDNTVGSIQSNEILNELKVNWKVDKNKVIVELFDKRDNPITSLGTAEQNKIKLIAVNNDFTFFEHLTSRYNGNGVFEGKLHLKNEDAYTFFLFIDNEGTIQSLSTFQMENWEENVIPKDILLNKKIDKLNAVLQFPPLFEDEPSILTFQLKGDKGKNKLNPLSEQKGYLYIVNEDASTMELIYPEKQVNEDKVNFQVIFSNAGNYQLWGEFQWNGQTKIFPYVVQVQKREI